MSDHQLLNVLKTLGYSNASITSIMAGAESAAQAESLRAADERRRGMTELTPIQACSTDPKKLRLWVQTVSMIKHCSAHKYVPREDQPIDVHELNAAIRDASVLDRAAIKANLSAIGLIR